MSFVPTMCVVQAVHITGSSATLLFLDKWLFVIVSWMVQRDGISHRRAGLGSRLSYGGIRSDSVKICPLITFRTNDLFAAAWRSTGDQSGDDT